MPEMTLTELVTGATTLTCFRCGIVFAVPVHWKRKRREDHESFWCPNGHSQYFPGKSEAERLREQLAAANERAERERRWRAEETERKQTAQRQSVALRGVVTRTKNRIAKGKCPCCRKQFPDLAAHMQGEHPYYGATDAR